MDPLAIFISSSLIVVAVMLFSTLLWIRITPLLAPSQRTAGRIFTACFVLYAFGQTVALLSGVHYLGSAWWDVASYSYGLAALLFGLGSWLFYTGTR